MRHLLFALSLFAATAPLQAMAGPCRNHCADRARECKYSCKAEHGLFTRARESCVKECSAQYYGCKSGC